MSTVFTIYRSGLDIITGSSSLTHILPPTFVAQASTLLINVVPELIVFKVLTSSLILPPSRFCKLPARSPVTLNLIVLVPSAFGVIVRLVLAVIFTSPAAAPLVMALAFQT